MNAILTIASLFSLFWSSSLCVAIASTSSTNNFGGTPTNYIHGNVFEDLITDCNPQLKEHKHHNWIVQLSGSDSLFTTTDAFGNYAFTVDTGTYFVDLIPPNPYWNLSCPSATLITFPTPFDTFKLDFPTIAIYDCPYLEVDISPGKPNVVSCEQVIYHVHYCNSGPATAFETFIEISLDPLLILDSASIAYTEQIEPTEIIYTFTLDSLKKGDCNSFKLYVTPDCSVFYEGLTYCVEAHIFPDSLCLPTPDWAGASVEVRGFCDQDSVRFEILNVGDNAMEDDLHYIVIEDEVILREESFRLDPGDGEASAWLGGGRTLRLEAEQEANHPGNNRPSVTISGCGGPPYSQGFTNQYPQNDNDPFVDIDCRDHKTTNEFISKIGYPLGYGEEHLIEADQEIEYFIYFRNLTAKSVSTVIIRDTLPPELNPATLRVASSSHPYKFRLEGPGHLQIAFSNIDLPSSNYDVPHPDGFIKFHISPHENLAAGTVITNKAWVAMDEDSLFQTNEYFHTIGENFILVSNQTPPNNHTFHTKIFPNPFARQTTIEVGHSLGEAQFDLYDAAGQLIYRRQFSGRQYHFQAGDLPKGLYLFKIENNKKVISSGKLLIK